MKKRKFHFVVLWLLIGAMSMGLFSCAFGQTETGTQTGTNPQTSEEATGTSTGTETNAETASSATTDSQTTELISPAAKPPTNGIVIPEEWPPNNVEAKVGGSSGQIPYLLSIKEGGTRPDVIDISTGRQLFVDNFLIESTTLNATAHQATPYTDSPIMVPDTATDGKAILLSGGGVWYDEEEKIFKMWYLANWTNGVAYATSRDGIHWEKPIVKAGSNIVYKQLQPDSVTVWMNKNATNPNEKYVLFVRTADTKNEGYTAGQYYYPGYIYTSADGINWNFKTKTGVCGDRSTIYYDAFLDSWCFSIRSYITHGTKTTHRARRLFMCKDLVLLAQSDAGAVNWIYSDTNDRKTQYVEVAEIYNVDAIAYESIMLSTVEIFEGPDNTLSNQLGFPKVTEITLAYSRDGFHYDRSNKTPIIEASQTAGTWNQGYLSPACGVCVTVGDSLYFYYSGWEASDTKAYDTSRIGLATMRRDGFVSMDGSGELLTRKLKVEDGRSYLFINAKGTVKAEILDENGNVYSGYSMKDCVAFSGDSTCSMIGWKGGSDLSFLEGKTFSIRFETSNAEFYSFWLSDTLNGDSHGYHAAGLAES